MRKACVWELLACVMLGIMVQGCGVYTTYQSARVLPPGHVAPGLEVGGGGAPALGGYPMMFDLGPAVRVGIGKNVDIGLRPTLLYADVKYQFRKGSPDGAFDLGVSYWPTTNADMFGMDMHQDFGLYPMALFSADHYFYGARVVCVRQVRNDRVSLLLMPGVIAGLSIGSRFRFLPAFGLYYCTPSHWTIKLPLAFGLGFGLEYEFGNSGDMMDDY
jgi:hypothetical protein